MGITLLLMGLLLFNRAGAALDQPNITLMFNPAVATLGASSPHTVRCNYFLPRGKTLMQVCLLFPGDIYLAVMYNDAQFGLYYTIPDKLRERVKFVNGSLESAYLSVTFKDTLCTDASKGYQCRIESQAYGHMRTDSRVLQVKGVGGAAFGQPEMSVKLIFNPAVATVGASSPHTVRCNYFLPPCKQLSEVILLFPGDQSLAGIYYDGRYGLFYTIPQKLRERVKFVNGSLESAYLSVTFKDTLCTDALKEYQCRITAYYSNPRIDSGVLRVKDTDCKNRRDPIKRVNINKDKNEDNTNHENNLVKNDDLSKRMKVGKTFCNGKAPGGMHAIPRNCTHYIQCVHSSAMFRPCSPGTAFNAATQTCDHRSNVPGC